MSIGKMGVLMCDGCHLPIKTEHLQLIHSFVGQATKTTMDFCSSECIANLLYDEVHGDWHQKDIDDLRSLLCPKCWEKTA